MEDDLDPPRYREVEAKGLLRRSTVVDPWFLGRFGTNLYRGCEHGCIYCDGRAEKYQVRGRFDRDIEIKRNALTLAATELDKLHEPGFLFVGGGVCDAYQPAEARFGLARGLLQLCRERRIPVHVLTKSALVERDLDLLAAINADTRAILSFSIALTDETQRRILEPRAAPLEDRWRILERAHQLGLGTGVMAMPLVPGLSDQPAHLDVLARRVRDAGADFMLIGGLTLRPGVQRDGMLAVLAESYPDLVDGYRKLFREPRASGFPDPRYAERLDTRCRAALKAHGLAGRIPHRLFHALVPLYTELAVLLEHRGFERGEPGGGRGPLARAAQALSGWARTRLSHHRGRDAFRLIESELAFLVHGRLLHEIPGLPEAVFPEIEQLLSTVVGGRSS